jgi:hypothetical protein
VPYNYYVSTAIVDELNCTPDITGVPEFLASLEAQPAPEATSTVSNIKAITPYFQFETDPSIAKFYKTDLSIALSAAKTSFAIALSNRGVYGSCQFKSGAAPSAPLCDWVALVHSISHCLARSPSGTIVEIPTTDISLESYLLLPSNNALSEYYDAQFVIEPGT